MTTERANAQLEMITPEQFRDEYAPKVGVPKIRELFASESFPAVVLGSRRYTTRRAAEDWLAGLGKEN
jgi:hypothetical protein